MGALTVAACLQRDVPGLNAALGLNAADAKLEIRVLLGHALNVNRAWLIAHEHDPLDEATVAHYQRLIARRLKGEPIAYILGEKEFFGRNFKVAPGVLIPRPETELLVELALEKSASYATPRLLDLGTGSGCIAISLALECAKCHTKCDVSAVDYSTEALNIARNNATRLGAAVSFYQGNWYQALPASTGKLDLIISNPPYIAEADAHLAALGYEPEQALTSGADGLRDIRLIVCGAQAHLNPGGWLMLEHGWDQAKAVQALLNEQGFSEVDTRADLAGIGRVTLGRLA